MPKTILVKMARSNGTNAVVSVSICQGKMELAPSTLSRVMIRKPLNPKPST